MCGLVGCEEAAKIALKKSEAWLPVELDQSVVQSENTYLEVSL
jgi:hypothetical protein